MSIAEENSQEKRMKEVIESGMKFNKMIDELLKSRLKRQKRLSMRLESIQ